MMTVPPRLYESLQRHDQLHVLHGWDSLPEPARCELVTQLEAIDLSEIERLFAARDAAVPIPRADQIAPVPVVRLGSEHASAQAQGETLLRAGKVGVILVAGGQGARLNFAHPKGMFPIGPVSNKTLFQIHVEKVLALSRRYGRPLPLLIMTSHATHESTVQFFEEHRYFGLEPTDVVFFQQGEMPAVDATTGRLLMAARGRVFTSPNGHGGTLTALADAGLLDEMRRRGVEHLFYFQVDNPLVRVAEPAFLGLHVHHHSEVSCKVIAKESAQEKMGNFVQVDGQLSMIEYSDLPDMLANQTDPAGRLRIWAGNPAIHIFSLDFLSRLTQGHAHLPYHVARKKVPYLDSAGHEVRPDRDNAFKFEMFIFDAFPAARKYLLVEASRAEEFMPLKNADGPDSPATVRQALSNQAATWLSAAGVSVPRSAERNALFPLEISPQYALDVDELKSKVPASLRIDGPLYLK